MESQPENLKSDALKHPAPYPEANKFILEPARWDEMVAKYGEEKVKQYYRKNEKLPEFTATISIKAPLPKVENT